MPRLELTLEEGDLENFRKNPRIYENQLLVLQFSGYFQGVDIQPLYCGVLDEVDKIGDVAWITLKNHIILDKKICELFQTLGFDFLIEKNLLKDIYRACKASNKKSEKQSIMHFSKVGVIGTPKK